MHSCAKRLLSLLLFLPLTLLGQPDTQAVTDTILQQDAQFWDAYNRCDADIMATFFTPDVEFYHDKGGETFGLDNLTTTFRKNLCGNPNSHLRREAVPGTVHVFPLQKNNVVYGAVLTGDHYFYVNDRGKPEYRDGLAKFFHVWLLKDGTWKMARVVSYDHRDAPYENTRKEITLPPQVLDRYVGAYKSPKSGAVTVTRDQNLLNLKIGEKTFLLYPESEKVFFTKDRDLTFEFVMTGNRVSKFIVRGHGAVADEADAVR